MTDRIINVSEEEVLHRGWLKKQGGAFRTWQRRFFKIAGDFMYYYAKEEDTRALGYIPLRGNIIKKHPHNAEEPGKYLFEILPGKAGMCRFNLGFSTSSASDCTLHRLVCPCILQHTHQISLKLSIVFLMCRTLVMQDRLFLGCLKKKKSEKLLPVWCYEILYLRMLCKIFLLPVKVSYIFHALVLPWFKGRADVHRN